MVIERYEIRAIASSSGVSAEDFAQLDIYYKYELWYCKNVLVPDCLFVNIDESALQLVPDRTKIWSKSKTPKESVTQAALRKKAAHTALLGGCKADGTLLRPQVNWMAKTDRVLVTTASKQVIQYRQPSTHWSTIDSLMAYIKIVADEREALGVKAPFVIMLNWAPFHAGYAFRKKFFDAYGVRPCVRPAECHNPPAAHGHGGVRGIQELLQESSLIHDRKYQHTDRSQFLWTNKT